MSMTPFFSLDVHQFSFLSWPVFFSSSLLACGKISYNLFSPLLLSVNYISAAIFSFHTVAKADNEDDGKENYGVRVERERKRERERERNESDFLSLSFSLVSSLSVRFSLLLRHT